MKKSAGILLFRRRRHSAEVLLVHPGGPFWAKKDAGAWSIPKGEFQNEDPLQAAKREFQEETGLTPDGAFLKLDPVKQPGGKLIFAWALERDCDPSAIQSNTFSMEWPKGSGRISQFPEIDRAAWFSLPDARQKLLKGQLPLLDQLQQIADPPRIQNPKPIQAKGAPRST